MARSRVRTCDMTTRCRSSDTGRVSSSSCPTLSRPGSLSLSEPRGGSVEAHLCVSTRVYSLEGVTPCTLLGTRALMPLSPVCGVADDSYFSLDLS
eukprot:2022832-Rhodomonas_salina.1